jgi:hypothetical protein
VAFLPPLQKMNNPVSLICPIPYAIGMYQFYIPFKKPEGCLMPAFKKLVEVIINSYAVTACLFSLKKATN